MGYLMMSMKLNSMNCLADASNAVLGTNLSSWLYYEEKGKRDTILEISKHLDDPSKLQELLTLFDERKKQPIDYRRSGVITIFVGSGLYMMGIFFLGDILKGAGALVGLIGVGTMIAGYLYPNTGKELTDAVEEFEKK